MSRTSILAAADCNCLVVRQAARCITQFYDRYLAEAGLRTTQYGILAKFRAAELRRTLRAVTSGLGPTLAPPTSFKSNAEEECTT